MHDIEPYFNWRHIYIADEDNRSPFAGRTYNEFAFTQQVYNYYIHPQWDDFESRTLYCKILMADYEEQYAIIELMGEWNDAIENDIDFFKRGVIDFLMEEGINKFILIADNVLNFHSGVKDYYSEWYDEVSEEEGWIVMLNLPIQSQYDFKKSKLNYYIELAEKEDWRRYKPYHLFCFYRDLFAKRL
jgi:hypothetical protein